MNVGWNIYCVVQIKKSVHVFESSCRDMLCFALLRFALLCFAMLYLSIYEKLTSVIFILIMMLLSLASFRHFDLFLIAAKVIDDGRWKEILSKGANCCITEVD